MADEFCAVSHIILGVDSAYKPSMSNPTPNLTLPIILHGLLPGTCVLCRQTLLQPSPSGACTYCWHNLPRNITSCLRCALPNTNLPHDTAPKSGQNTFICPPCNIALGKHSSDERALGALLHEAEARHLVHCLKFKNGYREGTLLAHAMLQQIEAQYATDALPQLLIPVPLSRWNWVKRGYNQAGLLAKHLSKQLSIPMTSNTLVRKHGPAQRQKTKVQRHQLPMSTFVVKATIAQDHVAIIDDVMTTGRTTQVIRNLLHAQGLSRVDIWCACRAVMT